MHTVCFSLNVILIRCSDHGIDINITVTPGVCGFPVNVLLGLDVFCPSEVFSVLHHVSSILFCHLL